MRITLFIYILLTTLSSMNTKYLNNYNVDDSTDVLNSNYLQDENIFESATYMHFSKTKRLRRNISDLPNAFANDVENFQKKNHNDVLVKNVFRYIFIGI